MYKVLVVDDKPSQTELLCTLLAKIDVECIVANSGKQAVELAKRLQPDLILMDWVMPEQTLSGVAATRQILSDDTTRHIPVIACSALADLHKALDAGCVDYVSKPFQLDDLFKTVSRHLR